MELQTRPPHSRVLHIQAAAGEDSNYYEHVEWGPSNNEKLSQPPNETVNSEKTRSKSHIVLLSCVVFAVCLILALLIVVTVLLSLEFSASKYQREIQFLMVEVSEINKLTQNVTGISTQNHERLEEVLRFTAPEGTFYNPVGSCRDITTNASGYYWIRNRTSTTPVQVYCDFNSTCNATGVWMRVAELNMTNSSQECPEGFRLLNSTATQLRLCTRSRDEPGCTSLIFDTYDIEYLQVCGWVRGYQMGSPDAFDARVNVDPRRTLDEIYVDGVSITHGRPMSRQHIWTFAAARDETIPSCACTSPNETYTGTITPEVGQDYFCATGSRDIFKFGTLYDQDPLWDGEGCGIGTTCCSFNNPPLFSKELPEPTSDSIELRVCTDEDKELDEDVLLEAFEMFIN